MTSPTIEICPFPQGKKTALTLSFDDGVSTDRPVIEKFNQWGLKATWNLNSGAFGGHHESGDCPFINASEVASLYQGHEVAIHTVTHPFLQHLAPVHVAQEILDDKIALENLVGYPVRGMAYPFGTYNQQVIDTLRGLGIAYCRGVADAENFAFPEEPLAWSPTCHQFHPDLHQKFHALHSNKYRTGIFYIWGHTYEFKVAKDWPAVERIFKPLASLPDVWYCANIELVDYQIARRRLVLSGNRKFAYNPSANSVWLRVNKKLLEVPGGANLTLT